MVCVTGGIERIESAQYLYILLILYCDYLLYYRNCYCLLQIVGEMYAGESFGELSLLHGTKRAATIICKGSAEFLRVDKSDFDGVRTK